MTPTLFPLKQRIISNKVLLKQDLVAANNMAPSVLLAGLQDYSSNFEITYQDFSPVSISNATQVKAVADQMDDAVFKNRLNDTYFPYRFGSFYHVEANNATKVFKAAIFVNATSQEVAAAYPHFYYQAVLRQALGKPNLNFKVTTTPYPITEKLKQRAALAGGSFTSFVVSIGFALIPATIASFILNEREKNLKHMQLISGMSLPAYWISNLIFDLFKGLIPSAIVIGLIYAYDLQWDNSWLMFILYPVGVIPFTYVTSFFFASENVAQTITIFVHFVFGGIGAIVVLILRLIESTQSVGDALAWAFRVIPSFCLTDTIMFDSSKARLFLVRPSLKKDSDYDLELIGGDVLVLCLHFIFWLLVLLAIELGAFNWTKRVLNLLPKNKIPPKLASELNQDEDVIEEEERVAALKPSQVQVRVNKFRKVYPSLFRDPVMAVEKTSFGLDYGECFALLGINGAGKSTTFKTLTCEIEPTEGEITINGFDA
jgi:ATP-binding cassette subfamily A (ABC1) protein 3